MSIVTCLAALAIGMIHAYPAVAMARWEEANFKFSTAQTMWFGEFGLVTRMNWVDIAKFIFWKL